MDLRRVAGEVGATLRGRGRRSSAFGLRGSLHQEGTPGDVGSLAVTGDEDRLVQVVSNLVENALRCTLAGGQVTIETTASRIAPGSATPAPGWEATICQARLRALLPLRAAAPGTEQVGTGLGLAIVKELTDTE